jgi:DMSO/TMAO reductase YedYZ molybdopterin-dependent catalytic subunit
MRLLAACALFACTAAAPLTVTGLVQHPGPVTLDKLKSVTLDAKFSTMHGPQAHHWAGPLLRDVVNEAGVTDEPGKKTFMRHVIMARGADGYAVSIAIAEIDPMGEAKQVIVALRQDDKPLPTPRLIVPGDASFARGVHDLKSLDVR